MRHIVFVYQIKYFANVIVSEYATFQIDEAWHHFTDDVNGVMDDVRKRTDRLRNKHKDLLRKRRYNEEKDDDENQKIILKKLDKLYKVYMDWEAARAIMDSKSRAMDMERDKMIRKEHIVHNNSCFEPDDWNL